MDQTREDLVVIDLECGRSTKEEEEEEEEEEEGVSREPILGVRKGKLKRARSGFLNDVHIDVLSLKVENEGGTISSNSLDTAAGSLVDTNKKAAEGEELVSLLVKKTEEKHKKKNSKLLFPKPPRPPKGPTLDAADRKFIREISAELAMLKRVRIERMKAHNNKKMKEAKTASSNTTLYSIVITILFCLVIISQGTSSRGSSSVRFQGSPQSAVAMGGRMMSIPYYKELTAKGNKLPLLVSPSLAEQVFGPSSNEEKGSRVVG